MLYYKNIALNDYFSLQILRPVRFVENENIILSFVLFVNFDACIKEEEKK